MSASMVLSSLPRDASAALAEAGAFPLDKVVVRFRPIGNAPTLNREVFRIGAAQKLETVASFVRGKLRVRDTESVFLYVNSSFAPSLDEVVGNLHQVRTAQGQVGTSLFTDMDASVSRMPTIS